ncbi:hypothetical protein BN2475_150085 [Paraburkholderia ribeironis]|uniref:Uncharacterized protein n=1 Tax=Paraburkholderia ribeironis TaxID=1247936 RepID=A0A1N7RTI4_9BURK|nr:hypothetical protein [Paraburkholderia ribeironis]SIT38420.1 hypothetical protein BN2475_150085 [Paraburkholderia ribeironis]
MQLSAWTTFNEAEDCNHVVVIAAQIGSVAQDAGWNSYGAFSLARSTCHSSASLYQLVPL